MAISESREEKGTWIKNISTRDSG